MVIGALGHELYTDKEIIENSNKYRYLKLRIGSDGRNE